MDSEGVMDVLVLLEECDDDGAGRAVAPRLGARPLAYVRSAPDPFASGGGFDRRRAVRGREVVTLCAAPDGRLIDARDLAVALAATVEGRRAVAGPASAVQHLGVWDGLGAAGDCAWRDRASGELVSQHVRVDAAAIEATAAVLLRDAGRLIRQTVAELSAVEWPEGARRAISFALPVAEEAWAGRHGASAALLDDALLASLREADGATLCDPAFDGALDGDYDGTAEPA